ncbi:MAG: DUF3159 domain-containing protein [Candidatus Nanopelagicales bacterium]|nr:DUF3159 domain-containing protein [Micrococcales bacterium]
MSQAQAHPEAVLLERAIGGWRGMFDSGLPAVVFVAVYLLNGRVLQPALIAALGAGVVILVWRLIRRQPLTQVLAGFAGVAISAYVSSRTGEARDFFLWGLIVNVAYGSAFLISLAVRWPLMGVVVGAITGDPTGWRRDPELRRIFAAATWVWVLVFGGRILVQVPLYLAGWVGALGTAKIIMGWPLFLFGAYVTYRLLRPVFAQRRSAEAAAEGPGDPSAQKST